MPGIDAPFAILAELKEAMTSTGKKILQSRSADYQMFSEPSTDSEYAVKGIAWEMWLSCVCACRFSEVYL